MILHRESQELDQYLVRLGKVMVAFSGGVDSTALLHACRRALGKDSVLAVTADSESFPRHEMEEAVALAEQIDAQHLVVNTKEMQDPSYRENRSDRCYFCKKELFTVMESIAAQRGVTALLYGAIADDLQEYRPGAKAASEFHVLAPFQDLGWTKERVRDYSKFFGLPTANKPAFACLSSRVPHGTPIRPELLRQVEQAESVLRDLGFRQYRVRHYGDCARLELDPSEILRALQSERSKEILRAFQSLGYCSVWIDLRGYQSKQVIQLRHPLSESAWREFKDTDPIHGVCVYSIHDQKQESAARNLEKGILPDFPLFCDLAGSAR